MLVGSSLRFDCRRGSSRIGHWLASWHPKTSIRIAFMPQGKPTVEQLWSGEVSFFSIDTDLIQAAGYNFDEGALHQLPNQLPPWMKLFMSEVVAQEIVRHRMQPVTEAVDKLTGASSDLKRLAKTPLEPLDQNFAELQVGHAAAAYFRDQIEAYAARCRGAVLPIQGESLTAEIFGLYFGDKAPFGKRRDKKSEFPDATSLLLLEQHAIQNDTTGIIASGDGGWAAFAEGSEHLYAVKSVEELAELFVATNAHAQALRAKIEQAISNPASPLRAQLAEELREHVTEADWDVSEVFSSSGRVEAEVYAVDMSGYEVPEDQTKVWATAEDRTTWIVEVTAHVTASVHISVDFFIWDSIDREELSFGNQSVTHETELELKAFLTCSDVQLDSEPAAWSIETDLASGSYSVGDLEVEQDFGDAD